MLPRGGDSGGFGELPADVDDGPRRGKKRVATPGLAGDVRDVGAVEGCALGAQAGDHNAREIFHGNGRFGDDRFHNIFGSRLVVAARRDQPGSLPLRHCL